MLFFCQLPNGCANYIDARNFIVLYIFGEQIRQYRYKDWHFPVDCLRISHRQSQEQVAAADFGYGRIFEQRLAVHENFCTQHQRFIVDLYFSVRRYAVFQHMQKLGSFCMFESEDFGMGVPGVIIGGVDPEFIFTFSHREACGYFCREGGQCQAEGKNE
jgi:hypothetical protein